MTRDEIIDVLIEERISYWVFARCYEDLEDVLFDGWKGFNDYTDDELAECLYNVEESNFDDETEAKIKEEKLKIEQSGLLEKINERWLNSFKSLGKDVEEVKK